MIFGLTPAEGEAARARASASAASTASAGAYAARTLDTSFFDAHATAIKVGLGIALVGAVAAVVIRRGKL